MRPPEQPGGLTGHQLALAHILNDIISALNTGLPYSAVSVALSVPDICSSLQYAEDDQRRFRIEVRYVEWCERFLIPAGRYTYFTGLECWALRGGVVHNGRKFGHPKARYDRVLFTLRDNTGNISHQNLTSRIGDDPRSILHLDAVIFCSDMVRAALEWARVFADDEVVAANIGGLVRLRPEGYPPHIVGLPVIT